MYFSFPVIYQHRVLHLKSYVVHVMGVKCYLDAVLTCNKLFNICFLSKFLLRELFVSFLLRICIHLVHKHTITLLSVKVFLNLSYNFLFFFLLNRIICLFVVEPVLVYLSVLNRKVIYYTSVALKLGVVIPSPENQ